MQKVTFKTLGVIMTVTIFIRSVDGKLLVRPRDTVAVVGHLTYFNCSTVEPDGKILWQKGNKHVYAGDKILNVDDKRFSVELDNMTGSCNLVIRNVTTEDAGSYSCTDAKDIDNPSVAALSILDSGPLCSSNVKSDGLLGPNDCNIVPEVLNLSCSVTYHGNTPPALQWKSVNDQTPAIINAEPCKIFSSDTSNGGKVECNVTVKAEPFLHNSSFVCQTSSAAIEQYSCNSDPIIVLYGFNSFHVIEKTINETVHCTANSTAKCNYKWLLNNTVIEDGSSVVTLHRPGVHRCEAMCDMRGSQCSVTAMLVQANTGPEPKSEAETSSAIGTSGTLAIVFGVLFSIVLIICLCLCLCRYKDKRRRSKGENHVLNEIEGRPLIKTGLNRDSVLIIGPFDGSRITDEILKINLRNPSEMCYVEEVPIRMNKLATAAVYHNTVYVVGLGTYADEIWKYESKSGWNKCACLKQGRRRHCAAFVDEVLYICGGFFDKDKSSLDSVEAYNAVDRPNTCKSVGKLVYPVLMSGNCVAYKNSLYIFGGADRNYTTLSDVQVYDTVQNTCHLLSKPMPHADYMLHAVLWGESVILLGPWNCFIYDFSTETWQMRKEFKTNVACFGLVLSNGRIYVFGGGTYTIDAERKDIWTCRDDVRSVAIEEIIEDKPVQWKVHGRLPRPCLVQTFAHLNEHHDNKDEVGHQS